MSTARKVAKNSGIIIASQILEALLNLLIITALARYFGLSGFGKLAFLGVFFFFIGSADNLLIRPILVREMARNRGDISSFVGNGMIIRVIFSLITVLICWLTILIIKCPIDIIQLAVFTSIGLILSSFSSSYESVYQANFNMGFYKGVNIGGSVATLFLLYLVIFFKGGLLLFNMLALLPGLASLIMVKYYSDKMLKLDFRINFHLWKEIFRESWPLLASAVFIFIYHRIDQIILLKLSGPSSLGLYSVAVKIAEMFNIIPVALKVSILPIMSGYFLSSMPEFKRIYRLSFKYLLLFIIPSAAWFLFFSKDVIVLLFGAQFSLSGPVLSILLFAEIFVFMGVINNAILIAADQQKLDPFFTGTSAVINIVLNLILIPKYGITGAAVASALSYPVGPVMGCFIKATRTYSFSMFYYSLRPLIASLAMLAFIWITRSNLLISMAISPIIYAIVIYFIRGLDRSDLLIIRSVFLSRLTKADE